MTPTTFTQLTESSVTPEAIARFNAEYPEMISELQDEVGDTDTDAIPVGEYEKSVGYLALDCVGNSAEAAIALLSSEDVTGGWLKGNPIKFLKGYAKRNRE